MFARATMAATLAFSAAGDFRVSFRIAFAFLTSFCITRQASQSCAKLQELHPKSIYSMHDPRCVLRQDQAKQDQEHFKACGISAVMYRWAIILF